MIPAPHGAGSCPPTLARGTQPAAVRQDPYVTPRHPRVPPPGGSTLGPQEACLHCSPGRRGLPHGEEGRSWSWGSAGLGAPSRAPAWARRSAGHGPGCERLSLPQWTAGGTRGHRLWAETGFRLTVPRPGVGPPRCPMRTVRQASARGPEPSTWVLTMQQRPPPARLSPPATSGLLSFR